MDCFRIFSEICLVLFGSWKVNREIIIDEPFWSTVKQPMKIIRQLSFGWTFRLIINLFIIIAYSLDNYVHVQSLHKFRSSHLFETLNSVMNGICYPSLLIAITFLYLRRTKIRNCLTEVLSTTFEPQIVRQCWMWICFGFIGNMAIMIRPLIAAVKYDEMPDWEYCEIIYHCTYDDSETTTMRPLKPKLWLLALDSLTHFEHVIVRMLPFCLVIPLSFSFRKLATRFDQLTSSQLLSTTTAVPEQEASAKVLRTIQELGREHFALTQTAGRIEEIFREYFCLWYIIDITRTFVLLGYSFELENDVEKISSHTWWIFSGMLISLVSRTIILVQLDYAARLPYMVLQDQVEIFLADSHKPIAAVVLQRMAHHPVGMTCWGICPISRKFLGSLFLTIVGYVTIAWEFSRSNPALNNEAFSKICALLESGFPVNATLVE